MTNPYAFKNLTLKHSFFFTKLMQSYFKRFAVIYFEANFGIFLCKYLNNNNDDNNKPYQLE